jgi:hypothetical protein
MTQWRRLTLSPIAQATDTAMNPVTTIIPSVAGSLTDDVDGSLWTSSCYQSPGANYHSSTLALDFAPIEFPLDTNFGGSVWVHLYMRAKTNPDFTSAVGNAYLQYDLWKTGAGSRFDYNTGQYLYDNHSYDPVNGEVDLLLTGRAPTYDWYRFAFFNGNYDIPPNDPDMLDGTIASPSFFEWMEAGSGSNLLDALSNTGLTIKICSHTQIDTTQRDLVDIAEFRLVVLYDGSLIGPPPPVPFWRNLVTNPSGEQNYNIKWAATNGTVETNVTWEV